MERRRDNEENTVSAFAHENTIWHMGRANHRMLVSTVSRVANSKYVSTPYGNFLLKFFFSEAMQTDSGEEVSTREVKQILKECIDAEDTSKPLTDDRLSEILKERGYIIARRTIAVWSCNVFAVSDTRNR